MATLDQLRPGQHGRIVTVEGSDSISSRLREMGMVPGQVVQLLRIAPLGDPLKCLVQGCRIALRSGEARRVMVTIDS